MARWPIELGEGRQLWPQADGTYCIAWHAWMPGVYESQEAAMLAFSFDDGELQDLQDSVNPGGTITIGMLKEKTDSTESDAP